MISKKLSSLASKALLPLTYTMAAKTTAVNHTLRVLFLALVLTSPLALTNPPAAHSQQVGTYTSDEPSYRAAFSIENNTGATIHYQVKWGKKHAWKSITLPSGSVENHTYPLGSDPTAKAPAPYVRFDKIAGDGNYTPQQYHMRFHATGYAGYGGQPNDTQPKRYFFQYGADGRSLDLFTR